MSEAAPAAFLEANAIAFRHLAPVGGGDICRAWRVETGDGALFLKALAGAPAGLFEAEAAGLRELASLAVLRVPEVIAVDASHLLLEYLPLARRDPAGDERLGEALAALHAVDQGAFGWRRDNFIGRTPQLNPRQGSWVEFFGEARLEPQLRWLERRHPEVREHGERLARALPRLLDGHAPHAACIHGDLWGGNAAALPDGTPVLFDPATHYADRECDLAMMRLFGGFSGRCFDAYEAALPLPPGAGRRRPLYQLYHVLNHANLFGGGYVSRALQLMADLVR